MIVTIHQPSFTPWTGYFDGMTKANVFVLLDTVSLTKGGFQNRVKIKGLGGLQWLTTPVHTKGRLDQLMRDMETNELRPWRSDHIKTLQTLYGRCSGFETAKTMLEAVYARETTDLAGLCTDLITRLRDHYAIPTKLVRALELEAIGSASELLATITAELGGDVCLSGPSGRSCLDEPVFAGHGTALDYHSFTPTPYPQPHGDFAGGPSMPDHLTSDADP